MNMEEKDIQEMLFMHHGLIEILMGFVTAKSSRKEFLNFVKSVESSEKYSYSAREAAKTLATDDHQWGDSSQRSQGTY